MPQTNQQAETLAWMGDVDGHLQLIDQTLLPQSFELIDCRDVQSVWEAIKVLRVRGAPAIVPPGLRSWPAAHAGRPGRAVCSPSCRHHISGQAGTWPDQPGRGRTPRCTASPPASGYLHAGHAGPPTVSLALGGTGIPQATPATRVHIIYPPRPAGPAAGIP